MIITGDAALGDAEATGGPSAAVLVRLIAMMLLEFVVFGSWFATLGEVLATHGAAGIIGNAYFLVAIAAIISPLFMGAVGDRYLAPRNLMSLLHFASACVIVLIPTTLLGGHLMLTLALIFITMLFFLPTVALANTIALVELGMHQRIFPYVRVFGTFGWALAGFGLAGLHLSASVSVFYAAAASGVLMAIVAQTLPHRAPPSADAHFSLGDLIGIKALVLFRDRRFAVLMLCALLTSISLGVYNTWISVILPVLGFARESVGGVMAMGQMSELAFIVTIPFVLSRIGMKWALLMGMGMWAVRFMLFFAAAHGIMGAAWIGVLLHGICSDYFIVVSAMFIAHCAPPELAAQGQSWLVLMVSGFGQAIGSKLSGEVHAAFVAPHAALGAIAWTPLLLLPVFLGVMTSAIWILLFPSKPKQQRNAA